MAKEKPFLPENSQDLQIFAEAQFQTILELNEEVDRLKNENKRLKQMVIVPAEFLPLSEITVSDEQSICQMELKRLQAKAIDGPLTFEETKKVQVYSELLLKMENKPKTFKISKTLSDVELLAIASNNETPSQ